MYTLHISSQVKLAKHSLTGQTVAIKILEKDRIREIADVKRVSREIKILKRVRHENVVQLYEVVDAPKHIFLVMEHTNGGELFGHIVRKRRLPETEAVRLFQDIVHGLEYLHERGIIHRDLKPENLLLQKSTGDRGRETLRVKIIDFGLSNMQEEGKALRTACGSPCYAAPEMVAGHKYDGRVSDIWSLGVVFFAMLAGYLPFEDSNTAALYDKILHARYKAPSWLSSAARDLLARMLTVDVRRRYRVADIQRHPWFMQQAPLPRSVVHVPSTEEEILLPLLRQAEQLGVQRAVLTKSLLRGSHNAASTTFYLLLHKAMADGTLAQMQSEHARMWRQEQAERRQAEQAAAAAAAAAVAAAEAAPEPATTRATQGQDSPSEQRPSTRASSAARQLSTDSAGPSQSARAASRGSPVARPRTARSRADSGSPTQQAGAGSPRRRVSGPANRTPVPSLVTSFSRTPGLPSAGSKPASPRLAAALCSSSDSGELADALEHSMASQQTAQAIRESNAIDRAAGRISIHADTGKAPALTVNTQHTGGASPSRPTSARYASGQTPSSGHTPSSVYQQYTADWVKHAAAARREQMAAIAHGGGGTPSVASPRATLTPHDSSSAAASGSLGTSQVAKPAGHDLSRGSEQAEQGAATASVQPAAKPPAASAAAVPKPTQPDVLQPTPPAGPVPPGPRANQAGPRYTPAGRGRDGLVKYMRTAASSSAQADSSAASGNLGMDSEPVNEQRPPAQDQGQGHTLAHGGPSGELSGTKKPSPAPAPARAQSAHPRGRRAEAAAASVTAAAASTPRGRGPTVKRAPAAGTAYAGRAATRRAQSVLARKGSSASRSVQSKDSGVRATAAPASGHPRTRSRDLAADSAVSGSSALRDGASTPASGAGVHNPIAGTDFRYVSSSGYGQAKQTRQPPSAWAAPPAASERSSKRGHHRVPSTDTTATAAPTHVAWGGSAAREAAAAQASVPAPAPVLHQATLQLDLNAGLGVLAGQGARRAAGTAAAPPSSHAGASAGASNTVAHRPTHAGRRYVRPTSAMPAATTHAQPHAPTYSARVRAGQYTEPRAPSRPRSTWQRPSSAVPKYAFGSGTGPTRPGTARQRAKPSYTPYGWVPTSAR